MSTFTGAGLYCGNCTGEMRDHLGDALACPRPVSQPLSRVVAGPEPTYDSEHKTVTAGRVYACRTCGVGAPAGGHGVWDHPRACPNEGERLSPGWVRPIEEATVASLIADVAAFRALTPEQRAALLRIGADGVALLEAARAAAEDPSNRETVMGLRSPTARIDMRAGRECSHCAFVFGSGHAEMPCRHQRLAAEKPS